jgi:hypothetical protein
MNVTEYRLLLHRQSGEVWAVRVEGQELTGVVGPLRERPRDSALPDLPYDEDPDTAEWVVRYFEEFTAIGHAS